MSDDFFVGYQPRQPSNIARFSAAVSGTLILVAVALSVTLSAAQDEPAEATFEFGEYRTYSGIVRSDPYPRLETADGSTVLLVAPFKHGADESLAPHIGTWLRLRGSLIQRGDLRMVEVDPGSIERSVRDDETAEQSVDTGGRESARITVQGEILDAKCWLGVMKPGRGTVHRACARLCVRGGIPALLSFLDDNGRRRIALFTTGGEVPVPDEILRWVARPVELTGSYDPDAAGGIGVFTVDARTVRVL